ncbi:MAG: multicopper oxidase domain-containing protein [Deltaproteobacteria bacterium]|nr:multicopper oxidase domain-containing protein [Deltaproteobacteria bacterium]
MKKKLQLALVLLVILLLPVHGRAQVKRYTFRISIGSWNILPDVAVKSLLINNQIPGPAIEVTEGDVVEVKVINDSVLPHTIHWHGLEVPNDQDGVPYVTQDPIEQGETYTYRFVAAPAGTRFWHCHWSTLLHISGGMYGPLIIHPRDPRQDLNRKYGVTLERTMMIDSIDPAWQDKMLTMMAKMHAKKGMAAREENHKSSGERLFADVGEYRRAIEDGYQSPYLQGLPKPSYKYHLINGHPYPLVPPVKTRVGDTVRLRLINVGNLPHYLHFHGLQLLVVAIDGNTLANPRRVNTVPIFPGQAKDLILQPQIPGWWAVHDHAEWGSTNNGHFPGGTMFLLGVADREGKISAYIPRISLTQ